MNVQKFKIADIRPAPYNPRKTLKPGDDEWEALSRSLERFGLVEPLIINEATGLLVSGHQRLNVLKAQGVKEVEAVVVDLDEDREKLLNIALNKIEGDWDYEKLKALFEEIADEDVAYTGFSEDELDALFDEALKETDEKTVEGGGGLDREAGASCNNKAVPDIPVISYKRSGRRLAQGERRRQGVYRNRQKHHNQNGGDRLWN